MKVSTQDYATTGTRDVLAKCRNYGRVVAGRFMRPSDVLAAGRYVYFEVFEDRGVVHQARSASRAAKS